MQSNNKFDLISSDPWESKNSEKPRAMLLKIDPDHLKKYKIDNINFLAAKFDGGPTIDLTKKEIFGNFSHIPMNSILFSI